MFDSVCDAVLNLKLFSTTISSVLHDLMLGGAKLGMNIRIATPKGYECNGEILEKTRKLAEENGTEPVFVTNVADEAVKTSDVVVTDTCKKRDNLNHSVSNICNILLLRL